MKMAALTLTLTVTEQGTLGNRATGTCSQLAAADSTLFNRKSTSCNFLNVLLFLDRKSIAFPGNESSY